LVAHLDNTPCFFTTEASSPTASAVAVDSKDECLAVAATDRVCDPGEITTVDAADAFEETGAAKGCDGGEKAVHLPDDILEAGNVAPLAATEMKNVADGQFGSQKSQGQPTKVRQKEYHYSYSI
jgi:hypothetical protein